MPKPANTPPFRADHVGSLLRPKELQAARAAWKAGTLPADALREVEDRCIAAAIAKQESIGLRAATDGEYRRAYWHYDFVAGLDGVEIYEPEEKIQFKGGVPLTHKLRVNGRIGWSKPVMIDHYAFLASHVRSVGAEADHPVAVGGAFPRWPATRSTGRPIRRWSRSSPTWGRRITRRSAHSGPPAAVICSSMRSTSPICATPNRSRH